MLHDSRPGDSEPYLLGVALIGERTSRSWASRKGASQGNRLILPSDRRTGRPSGPFRWPATGARLTSTWQHHVDTAGSHEPLREDGFGGFGGPSGAAWALHS